MTISFEQFLILKKMFIEKITFGKYSQKTYFNIGIDLNDSDYLKMLLDKNIIKDDYLKDLINDFLLLRKTLTFKNGLFYENDKKEIIDISTLTLLKSELQKFSYQKEISLNIEFIGNEIKISFNYMKEIIDYLKTKDLGFIWNSFEKKWIHKVGEEIGKIEEEIFNIFRDKTIIEINEQLNIKVYQINGPKNLILGNGLKEKIDSLKSRGIDLNNIENFNVNLFDYQKEGVAFLSEGNKLLGDDMGTGKTVQTLATIKTNGAKYNIVVCPKVTVYNWKKEILKYISDYKEEDILVVDGPGKKRKEMIDLRIRKKNFFLIYSYDSLKNDIKEIERLRTITFDTIVIDEAHYIGTYKNQRRKALSLLKGKHKIALTGTPFSNKLFHLWGILNFLYPEKYDENKYYLFCMGYFNKGEYGGFTTLRKEKVNAFESILKEVMLRRLKKDVLKFLPERIISEKFFEIESSLMKEYKEIFRKGYEKMSNFLTLQKEFTIITGRGIISNKPEDQQVAISLINKKFPELKEMFINDNDNFEESKQSDLKIFNPVFKIISELRQFLIKEENFINSPKMNFIEEIVSNYQESKRNIVILTTFVNNALTIKNILEKKYKNSVLHIDGSINGKKRDNIIEDFQTNSSRILIATTESVGIGVNLTNSDTIVYIDHIFDDKKMKQANDRIYRIGQTEKVQIINLMYENSIDEFIFEILNEKKDIVDDLYAGKGIVSKGLKEKFLIFLKNHLDE